MAANTLLSSVEVVIKGKSFDDIVRSSYGAGCPVECSAQTAQSALQSVKELLSNDGIAIASLKKSELNFFVRDAPKADAESFTLSEYQALLGTMTKYAALKARHNNGKRWGLGLALSAAGAMALTAAVFTSAGLVLIAAPAGAAVGAVAVAADGSKSRRHDRRTAEQGSTPAQAPAAAAETQEFAPAADAATDAAEAPVADRTVDIAPAGSEEKTADATPAPVAAPAALAPVIVAPPAVPAPAAPVPAAVTSSGNSSPRGSSDELVSAVVEFMPARAAPDSKPTAESDTAKFAAAAVAAAAADSKPQAHTVDVDTAADEGTLDIPAPVQCDSPFSSAAKDTGTAYDDLPSAPMPVCNSFSSDVASSAAGLPPKPKKSKSLTKSMSKKIKKAFSVKDKDSSGKDAGAHKALDADSDSPLAPPVPRRSGSFFRRSSDGTGSGSFFRRSSSDMGEVESVDGIERSKGSATMKKFVEGIRRSFSLDRPSLDLVTPKKARKAEA